MITLDQALAVAKENGRVCPQPQKWNELYSLLPDRTRIGNGWEPALPLILGAWDGTPAMLKILRLQEHIEWASTHDCLDKVYEYMRSLSEEEWFHIGD